jgi:uncharacterized protein
MVERSIINSVHRYLRILQDHGIDVHFGIVFGSRATGNTDEWSDIDLLVVSPRFDHMSDRKDIDMLWHLAARVDSRIEPIPCGKIQWEADNANPIIEISRREGEKIQLP